MRNHQQGGNDFSNISLFCYLTKPKHHISISIASYICYPTIIFHSHIYNIFLTFSPHPFKYSARWRWRSRLLREGRIKCEDRDLHVPSISSSLFFSQKAHFLKKNYSKLPFLYIKLITISLFSMFGRVSRRVKCSICKKQ